MVAGYDTVWLDFTKGLGAPLGAVLAGSTEFIGAAWRWKQRMGGALRQGGLCAAACLYALDNNIDRLAEDHANARLLARGLAQVPGLSRAGPGDQPRLHRHDGVRHGRGRVGPARRRSTAC